MFVYDIHSAIVANNYTTSATPNTEIDVAFVKSGATRNVSVIGLYVGGKGAGLTAISGIAYRLAKFPTTASSSGTAIVPTPRDPGMQASKHTAAAGAAGGVNAVTSGTGTKVYLGGCISGAAGPGGWVAPNPDAGMVLEGAATQSIDLWSSSATASMNYEFNIETAE